MSVSSTQNPDTTSRRRRPAERTQDPPWEHDPQAAQIHDRLCGGPEPSTDTCTLSSHHCVCPALCTTKCTSAHACPSHHACDDSWVEIQSKRTIRAENEVEANKLVNNYRFGFRKWKSHVTERPFEFRSEVVKELYSELNVIKPHSGHLITCGNVAYVFLFGWWVSLTYFLVGILMFITVIGVPYGKLCWKLSCYFLWPFGKSVHEIGNTLRRCCEQAPDCECNIEGMEDNSPVLLPSPTEVPIPELPGRPLRTPYWHRFSTYVWLLLGYPLLVVIHSLACFFSWILVFTIPVSKMNARTLGVILLLAPEDVSVSTCSQRKHQGYETRALLCCYHAVNWYYYKYTVDGINVFAVNLLPLVIVAMVIGYVDRENHYASSEVKFAIAISSIIPLSYYIGMGIASISAQCNFAVGAVVNATFGSITELTFYITALLRGHQAANPCLQEVVKAALTGTLLGCILFIPVSQPAFTSHFTAFNIGHLHDNRRTETQRANIQQSLYRSKRCVAFHLCRRCVCPHAVLQSLWKSGVRRLHQLHWRKQQRAVCLPQLPLRSVTGHHGAVVHWSRWRSLVILIMATVLTSACADLVTEHIQPILNQPNISQYFIGVTVLAMVPEIPEIVNGIQFALQNNISLSLEVGICIAVQVCMLQIPILVLFNAFYDVGFVLLFSDLHLWASIFSVILVNYIFMDGKSDYFQGTALVVVYLILLALYYFAPSPAGC
ncbi:putative cation exchanger C521.04c isoform X2 [Siniperca chuatsi]|uniref:putative cation exchanger C521.04c isoform X2 n=1 Tax=Siniperca chuatsi TaxID=119488 RepID=UPI001CE0B6AA|nr:putative cation exchanger C521.04c isoform X2 [Siniperca chuatsi]